MVFPAVTRGRSFTPETFSVLAAAALSAIPSFATKLIVRLDVPGFSLLEVKVIVRSAAW
jgi:hypothetical protein